MSNESKSDLVSTRPADSNISTEAVSKRPYARPTLTLLGSVHALTLASTGSTGYGGAGRQPSGG